MRSKQLKSFPEKIKPFVCHGVDMYPESDTGNGQMYGDCPYCGKVKKFYVSIKTGQFNCKVCGVKGNAISFMTDRMDEIYKTTPKKLLMELANERGKISYKDSDFTSRIPVKVLRSFKIGYDEVNECWCFPMMSEDGKTVRDIRRRVNKNMMATAGIKLSLGGEDRLKRYPQIEGSTTWLCEGEWDAVALQWLLKLCGITKDAVTWLPGADTFKPEWVEKYRGRNVVAIFDNDRPGDNGAVKAFKKLKPVVNKIEFINWPEALPKGFDTRDFIVKDLAQQIPPEDVYDEFLGMLEEFPRRLSEEDKRIQKSDSLINHDDIPEDEIASFAEVLKVYQRYMLMNEESISALKVMLAVCLSNEMKADPLWLYIVGPPGSGKTLLLSGLQSSARCKFVSTISAHSLVSGWRGEGEKDPSLIPQLKGRTFVAKDFTEILTMPFAVQDEIFSTLRGAYDGSVQRPFGNGVMREYEDCFFSMIAGVTYAIHGHAKASLGERFLKFQMNSPGHKQADDIVRAAILNVGREKKMEKDFQEVTKRFLGRNVDLENLPEIPQEYITRITALVQLIAILRAQVERDFKGENILYRPAPEAGTRLAKQLVKLGMMLAVVLERDEVDEEIFLILKKVAFDTAHGFHLEVVEAMEYLGGHATRQQISEHIGLPFAIISKKLDDLLLLKAISDSEHVSKTGGSRGGRPAKIYSLTARIAELLEVSGDIKCRRLKITQQKHVRRPRANSKKKLERQQTSA